MGSVQRALSKLRKLTHSAKINRIEESKRRMLNFVTQYKQKMSAEFIGAD